MTVENAGNGLKTWPPGGTRSHSARFLAKTGERRNIVLKLLLWAVIIIFIIGLLVVTGVLKLIF